MLGAQSIPHLGEQSPGAGGVGHEAEPVLPGRRLPLYCAVSPREIEKAPPSDCARSIQRSCLIGPCILAMSVLQMRHKRTGDQILCISRSGLAFGATPCEGGSV